MKSKILFSAAAIYTICVFGPMAAMSIGAGFVAFSWLITKPDMRKFLSEFRSQFGVVTIALCFVCIWSLVWAKLTGLEFYGMKPEIHWLKDSAKLWHILFPFLLAAVFRELSPIQLRKISFLWLLLGGASAVLGVLQHYLPIYNPQDLPNEGLRGFFHSTGMTGFHLSFAGIIAFPAMAWFAMFAVLYRRERFSNRNLIVLLGLVFFGFTSFFIYSKMMWIAVPVTLLFLIFFGLRGKIRYYILASVIALCVLLASLPEVRFRFGAAEPVRDRMEVWQANVEMVKSFPLFGVGWHHNSELSEAYYTAKAHDRRGFQSHAHNNFIDQLATTGILGALVFLLWCFLIVRMSFQIYQSQHDLLWRSLGLGFLGGWICLHLNGFTQTNFWDAKVMHQMGWVTGLTLEVFRRYVKKN